MLPVSSFPRWSLWLAATLLALGLLLRFGLPALVTHLATRSLQAQGCTGIEIAGLSGLWREWRIEQFSLECETASGRVSAQLEALNIRLLPTEKRVEQIRIGSADLQFVGAESGSASPWPKTLKTDLPLQAVQIDVLDVQLEHPRLPEALRWQASVQLRQTETGHWQLQTEPVEDEGGAQWRAELKPDSGTGLHLSGSAQRSGAEELRWDLQLLLQDEGALVRGEAQAQARALSNLHERLRAPLTGVTLGVENGRLASQFSVQFGAQTDALAQADITFTLGDLHAHAALPDGSQLQSQLHAQMQLTLRPDERRLQIQNLQAAFDQQWGDPQASNKTRQLRMQIHEADALQFVSSGTLEAADHRIGMQGQMSVQLEDPEWGKAELVLLDAQQTGALSAPSARELRFSVHAESPQMIHGGVYVHAPVLRGELVAEQQLDADGQDWLLRLPTPLAIRAKSARQGAWQSGSLSLEAKGSAALRIAGNAEDTAESFALKNLDLQFKSGPLLLQEKQPEKQRQEPGLRLQMPALHLHLRNQDERLRLSLKGDKVEAKHGDTWALRAAAFAAELETALEVLQKPDPQSARPPFTGTVQVSGLVHSQLSVDLQSALSFDGARLVLNGAVQKNQAQLLPFSVKHDLDTGKGELHSTLTESLATLQNKLSPWPAGWPALNVQAGELQLQANAHWQAGKVMQSDGLLKLNGLRAQVGASQIEGLDAQLEFQRGTQQDTQRGTQQDTQQQAQLKLTLPQAQLAAGIEARDVRIDTRLQDTLLQIRNAGLQIFGGTLDIAASEISLQAPEQALLLNARQLNLSDILAPLQLEGLSGEGRLSGQLPLLRSAEGWALRDGSLQSDAPGILRYAPAQLPMADNLGLQALRDFHYKNLRAEIAYHSDGRYQILLKLDGANPALYSGYPIAFTLNLTGQLPGMFEAALLSGDFSQHLLKQIQDGQLRPD